MSLHLDFPNPAERGEDIQGPCRVGFVCYNGRGHRCRRDNLFDRCFMVPQLSHALTPATRAFVTAPKHYALIDYATVSRDATRDGIGCE